MVLRPRSALPPKPQNYGSGGGLGTAASPCCRGSRPAQRERTLGNCKFKLEKLGTVDLHITTKIFGVCTVDLYSVPRPVQSSTHTCTRSYKLYCKILPAAVCTYAPEDPVVRLRDVFRRGVCVKELPEHLAGIESSLIFSN